ncbi:PRD domain-containing protein [Rothia nasimurium]|uniref:PRD domain-containing protein n=1 Tax=Rothia nasimurium TaxID=85336 RepID=A0A4Y9F3J5_9MICC|nr:PRD domain-containing protein [Rothia nasimurium]MBF0808207.1 PRD domain-containing protein [Rothia nasimurium]TFU22374.1 PRD domain-containing protein [Rothia nasimurium]
MKIAHIYNNNVVLARTAEDKDVVVIGRGLAFNKKKGAAIDPAQVEQTFVPENPGTDYAAAMLAELPSDVLALASELEQHASRVLGFNLAHSLVLPLADHLSYAIVRAQQGQTMEFPLSIEVAQLYPREYGFGQYAVQLVQQKLGVALQPEEATAFAMHLVNTQFEADDLNKTYRMTEVFAQIFSVISFAYNRPLDQNHMSVARFVTHLRYVFVRTEKDAGATGAGAGAESSIPAIYEAVKSSYPKAFTCAGKVKVLLEMHLGTELSADEQTYLAIHISRLAQDLWGDPSTA